VQMDERELVREARHARSLHAAPARLTAETMPRTAHAAASGAAAIHNAGGKKGQPSLALNTWTEWPPPPGEPPPFKGFHTFCNHHTEAEAPHRTHITMAVDALLLPRAVGRRDVCSSATVKSLVLQMKSRFLSN
jgi:hypothetical protein